MTTTPQGQAPELDRTAPERIWLQVDTDGDPEDRSDTFPRNGEQTWCEESIGGQEVEYVRADLAQVAALTAAPQGVAYAELPEPIWRTAQGVAFSERQLYDFADRTHALRAAHGQASSQAGEYPALVCDYCGALTPDPWHSSGMLHGKMSKHIHSCDACCRGAAQAAPRQEAQEPVVHPRHPAAVEWPSDSEIDALVTSIGPTEGIRKDSRDLSMSKLRMLVRRALATWGQVKEAPAAQGDALSDEAVRVPLDSLHADAAYLIGRLREGSMPYARVIEIIRERIDAAIAAQGGKA